MARYNNKVLRTLVLTTKWEGLVSQNPHRPEPSQSKENNNTLGSTQFYCFVSRRNTQIWIFIQVF